VNKQKREPTPDSMKNRIDGPIATQIADRISAAMAALTAKGYDCPKISIGMESMGDYGPIVYARINLSSPKCWMRRLPYDKEPKSIEGLLDEIDASVAEVPALVSIESQQDAALAKLTKEERELLGVNEWEIKMQRQR
jgi:hypothetical protein